MSSSLGLRSLLRSHVNKASKLVSATAVPSRGIAGKVMRDRSLHKPKPFPYQNVEYKDYMNFVDKTTLRFDENSKLIVVDGAHAVGKSKFCEELAEELEMKYVPEANMDFWYVNYYGEDMRELNEFMMPRMKSYDEKDFIRDPMGPVPGSADRMLNRMYLAKFAQYWDAIRHIFNTGQGVILEKSPFSHYAIIEAAYSAGYIARESRNFYNEMVRYTLPALLRPNLVIYLDAPIDVVQRNIKARGNEWDKDSPVWNNTQFLNDIYGEMKKNYLKEAKIHSQVVVYDWSEPGETEVVVEDLEELNFDYYGAYEEQQYDWRLHNETEASKTRIKFSSIEEFDEIMSNVLTVPCYDVEHLYATAEESKSHLDVIKYCKGNRYEPGFNEHMGDSVLFKSKDYHAAWYGRNSAFAADIQNHNLPFWELESGNKKSTA